MQISATCAVLDGAVEGPGVGVGLDLEEGSLVHVLAPCRAEGAVAGGERRERVEDGGGRGVGAEDPAGVHHHAARRPRRAPGRRNARVRRRAGTRSRGRSPPASSSGAAPRGRSRRGGGRCGRRAGAPHRVLSRRSRSNRAPRTVSAASHAGAAPPAPTSATTCPPLSCTATARAARFRSTSGSAPSHALSTQATSATRVGSSRPCHGQAYGVDATVYGGVCASVSIRGATLRRRDYAVVAGS